MRKSNHHYESIYRYVFQKSAIFHRLQFQLTNLCSFFFTFCFFVYTCISVYSQNSLIIRPLYRNPQSK